MLGTLFPESTVAGGGHSDVEGLGRNLFIYIIKKKKSGAFPAAQGFILYASNAEACVHAESLQRTHGL